MCNGVSSGTGDKCMLLVLGCSACVCLSSLCVRACVHVCVVRMHALLLLCVLCVLCVGAFFAHLFICSQDEVTNTWGSNCNESRICALHVLSVGIVHTHLNGNHSTIMKGPPPVVVAGAQA